MTHTRLRWGSWILVLLLHFGCSKPPGHSELSGRDFDQSCTTNDDCVRVESCVCGCGTECGETYTAIAKDAQERFEAQRQSARQSCLEPELEQRRSASCIGPGVPICVDDACRLVDHVGGPFEPTDRGPDEWDRSCSDDTDCEVATLRNCSLCGCDPEYVAVSRGEAEAAEGWDSRCEQYTDDCDRCDEPIPGTSPPVSARCVDGLCEVSDPDDFDFEECPGRADGESCSEAGCRRAELTGDEIVDGQCERIRYIVCVPADDLGDVTDLTPYYHRDGVLLPLTEPWAGWTACEGSPADVCDCRPG